MSYERGAGTQESPRVKRTVQAVPRAPSLDGAAAFPVNRLPGFSGRPGGFYEELIRLDLVDAAQCYELQKAWVCFFSGFEPGNISLRYSSALVVSFFGQSCHFAHGQFALGSQFLEFIGEGFHAY